MTSKIKHIVMTRLNQKWVYRDLHEDYMQYRLDLFEIGTLKSVIGQSDKDFTFIILTSPTLPDHIRERTESYSGVQVIYKDRKDGNQIPGRSFAKILLDPFDLGDYDKIVTTTIDSDDLMRFDYIKTVNNIARNENNAMPSLIRSLATINIGASFSKYVVRGFNPPLFSFVEDIKNGTENVGTCFCRGHKCINRNSKSIIDIDVPFVMLQHASNNLMGKSGISKKLRDYKYKLSDYGVDEKEILSFLRKEVPEDYQKREDSIRKYRRSFVGGRK